MRKHRTKNRNETLKYFEFVKRKKLETAYVNKLKMFPQKFYRVEKYNNITETHFK